MIEEWESWYYQMKPIITFEAKPKEVMTTGEI